MAIECFYTANVNSRLAGPAKGLLDKVLNWLKLLGSRRPEGFYFPGETNLAPYLHDHLYATEALLALDNLGIKGADELALNAVLRLLEELRNGTADLEYPVRYRVGISDHNADVIYENRSCIGLCLSVLARGTALLKGAESADKLATARKYAEQLKDRILFERRSESGLWPEEYVLFHWGLAAIESLLNYEQYVPPVKLNTTFDAISVAGDQLLADKSFRELFRRYLIKKIRESSMVA